VFRTFIHATAILAIVLPLGAQAQSIKAGTYLGLQYGHDNIGGEFDDTIVLASSTEVIDVPRVKAGGGAGLVLGYRTAGGGGFEFGWHRSSHRTSSVALGASDATFEAFDIDGKLGFAGDGALRVWALFGVGIVTMTVERSRLVGSSRLDARYRGASLNFGLGGAYYVTPQLGLTLDVFWRQTRFNTVQGTEIDGGLKAQGAAARVATIWTF
jgi:hypothetical protein